MMRSLVLATALGLALARSSRSRILTTQTKAWNLPQLPDHEQSIANFIASLPRGGQNYYDDDDDRGYQGDPYSRGDYYGENDRLGDDQDYDNDRGAPSRREKEGGRSFVPDIIKTGSRKIGLPLLGVGAALTVLGISLFFNKTLMRLGNLFFVAGVPLTIGPGRTVGYFLQPKKARATGCLALGILLVFFGHPVFGIILEAFGLLNLFGNMFPVAFAILKTMPVIGPLLSGNGRKKNNRYDDRYDDRYSDSRDSYYDDRNYHDDDPDDNRYY